MRARRFLSSGFYRTAMPSRLCSTEISRATQNGDRATCAHLRAPRLVAARLSKMLCRPEPHRRVGDVIVGLAVGRFAEAGNRLVGSVATLVVLQLAKFVADSLNFLA